MNLFPSLASDLDLLTPARCLISRKVPRLYPYVFFSKNDGLIKIWRTSWNSSRLIGFLSNSSRSTVGQVKQYLESTRRGDSVWVDGWKIASSWSESACKKTGSKKMTPCLCRFRLARFWKGIWMDSDHCKKWGHGQVLLWELELCFLFSICAPWRRAEMRAAHICTYWNLTSISDCPFPPLAAQQLGEMPAATTGGSTLAHARDLTGHAPSGAHPSATGRWNMGCPCHGCLEDSGRLVP